MKCSRGNETSLVRVKVDPKKYIGESIYLIGVIQSSSYYNYGYRNAESSHFSLDFTEFDSKVQRTRSSAHFYVPRSFSGFLIERMNLSEEARRGLLIRAKVTIDPQRYDGASSWDLLELEDWQLLHPDRTEWQGWSLEGFKVALGILSSFRELEPLVSILTKTEPYGNDLSDLYVRNLVGAALIKHDFDRKDIGVLVQLICSDSHFATKDSDSVVRNMAIAALMKQESSGKRYAARKLKREVSLAKREKNEQVLKWGTKAYNRLVKNNP